MIKFLKDRILPLFMVAWLGGLLPACVYDDEDTATGPEKTDGFNISIAISAGEASTARAEDGYDDGSVAENYININDLQIYAFSTGGKLLAQVYPEVIDDTVMIPEVIPIGNGKYLLKAELPYGTFSQEANQTFKLVAVANGGNPTEDNKPLGENTTLSELVVKTYFTTYEKNEAWTPQWGETGIPMFGVRTVSLDGYDFKVNDQFTPFLLKEVNMLRAMAKIEVGVAENVSGIEISSVTLAGNCYNLNGYIAPKTADEIEKTDNVTISNIPNSVNAGGEELSFAQVGKKFVAYVPEYSFAAGDSRDIMTLNVNNVDYTLSVSPYQDGKPTEVGRDDYPWQALLRNHLYRFTITGIINEKIRIVCSVTPWAVHDVGPEYGD